MQKKAILTVYGLFSILGLLSALFGVLILVLPLTKGEAIVDVDFPVSADSAQAPLTEKDKQAVFKALGQIIDQPIFEQALLKSGFNSIKKMIGTEHGRVAGDWTEKIKIQSDVVSSSVKVSVSGGTASEKKEVAGAVAQVLAMRAPSYIGGEIITTKGQTPYVSYAVPGWVIADLIIGGIFFFFAGAYGFVSQKFVLLTPREACPVAEKIPEKAEENKDPRYWLQKFLDENKN